jgi:DNA-binding NarL/FixJ family response regulator
MKALLIDDHPLILSALQTVIRGVGNDISVVAVDSAQAARLALAAEDDFDLVLLDLQLGDSNGFDLLVEFRDRHPSVPIVVVSATDRRGDVLRAIDLGAMGFVPKCASNDTLFEALKLVMSGGIYVPPMVMRTQMAAEPPSRLPPASPEPGRFDVAAGAPGTKAHPPLAALGLTPRQTDVMALLLQGQSNKLIARELNLSVETIKDHVAAVLRTLNVSSRTQAVLVVSEMSHQSALIEWRESRRGLARHGNAAPA